MGNWGLIELARLGTNGRRKLVDRGNPRYTKRYVVDGECDWFKVSSYEKDQIQEQNRNRNWTPLRLFKAT